MGKSIVLPHGLEWVSALAGGEWPEAMEGDLWDLETAHREFASEVRAVVQELGPVAEQVKSGISGATADAFEAYLDKMLKSLPDVAVAADQLADSCNHMALQVQYSKKMLLVTLAWMAAQIAFLAWWAPEGVAAIVAAGRAAVMMIMRRLLAVVGINVAMAALFDAGIQLSQMADGHRKDWDLNLSEMAWGAAAINGAIMGAAFLSAGALAPGFMSTLIGKILVGGASGAAGMAATDAAYGIDGKPGLGFIAGAFGGAIGHIPQARQNWKGGARGEDGAGAIKAPVVPKAPDLSGSRDLGVVPPRFPTEESGPQQAPASSSQGGEGGGGSGGPRGAGAGAGAGRLRVRDREQRSAGRRFRRGPPE
jgi:hypothetical protein